MTEQYAERPAPQTSHYDAPTDATMYFINGILHERVSPEEVAQSNAQVYDFPSRTPQPEQQWLPAPPPPPVRAPGTPPAYEVSVRSPHATFTYTSDDPQEYHLDAIAALIKPHHPELGAPSVTSDGHPVIDGQTGTPGVDSGKAALVTTYFPHGAADPNYTGAHLDHDAYADVYPGQQQLNSGTDHEVAYDEATDSVLMDDIFTTATTERAGRARRTPLQRLKLTVYYGGLALALPVVYNAGTMNLHMSPAANIKPTLEAYPHWFHDVKWGFGAMNHLKNTMTP